MAQPERTSLLAKLSSTTAPSGSVMNCPYTGFWLAPQLERLPGCRKALLEAGKAAGLQGKVVDGTLAGGISLKFLPFCSP